MDKKRKLINRKSKNGSKKEGATTDGVIRITQGTIGYVEVPGGKKDIEIESSFLNTALNGDRVRVKLTGSKRGRSQGEVIKILNRKRNVFVGELKKENGKTFVEVDDPKFYRKILLIDNESKNIVEGLKVIVELTDWHDPIHDPVGKVKRILGKPLEHETEIQAILYGKELPVGFPPEVEEEAKNARAYLKNPDIEGRRDLRNVTTFTIDPETAKDFDDALSIKKLDGRKFEIGIHIADVSYFVRPGTLLDQEASERATSIYMVDRTIPMLPETLSNDLCSLNPNEEKLAYSAIFEIDFAGNISSTWFGRTRIKSNKRFTYKDAQNILDNKSGEFYQELNTLNKISKRLQKKKMDNGAIAFKDTEVGFLLDEKMHPTDVFVKEPLETHKLVENYMLLANGSVATIGPRHGKNRKPFIYRVHDHPDADKISQLCVVLRALGHNVKTSGRITSKDINKILNSVKGTPEENLIQTMAIRSMAKAYYSMENNGHFGLAFPYYTHFTSPIRRYPDIIAHRLLDDYLNGKEVNQKDIAIYKKQAEHSSARERVAEEAERDSIKFKQAEYMKDHIGEEYSGVITGVARWGFYVADERTLAEGLVSIRNLDDDYYIYDDTHMSLTGKDGGRKFQLGDKVHFKVKDVDLRKKQINYSV